VCARVAKMPEFQQIREVPGTKLRYHLSNPITGARIAVWGVPAGAEREATGERRQL
jgi:hypothetical protein